MQLRLLAVIASGLGWEGGRDFTDPADALAGEDDTGPVRAADPGERAAQVAAFLAATGQQG
jgi:hypothetical protein